MSFDPANRQLCADEACIGLVGDDGKCKECGRPAAGTKTSALDPEFAGRQLCDDEACIGVIGSDGTCRDCGRPARSATDDPRTRGMLEEAATSEPAEAAEDAPSDFESRRLCPDGACIGVIGDDGKCRECGASA